MANLSPNLQASLSKLITANHILDHHSLVDAFGHISLRDPENPSNIYMTGQQQPPAFVADESDLEHYHVSDGTPVVRGDLGSSTHPPHSERFCHSEILKKYPGVQAVVHGNSPAVVAIGVSGVGLRPVYRMGGFLGDEVPVFDIADVYDEQQTSSSSVQRNMLVNTSELGERLASCLLSDSSYRRQSSIPDHTVVLQRGHGFCTWGENIEEAVWRAIYTQQNAKIQMSATDFSVVASGELRIQLLSQEEIRSCAAMNKQSSTKGWMYWSRLVESNPIYRNESLRTQIVAPASYHKTQSNRMEPF